MTEKRDGQTTDDLEAQKEEIAENQRRLDAESGREGLASEEGRSEENGLTEG